MKWDYMLVEKAFKNYLQSKRDIAGLMEQLDTTSTLGAYKELCDTLELYLSPDELKELENSNDELF